MTLHYDPTGSHCSGHCQPGTLALHRQLLQLFPALSDSWDGCYNCRPVRGGTHLSEHGEGRADDEHVSAQTEKKLGDAVAKWCVDNAEIANIQSVIWNHRVWGYGTWAWRDYHGEDPHTGHVHIGQNWEGALHYKGTEGSWWSMLTPDEKKEVQALVRETLIQFFNDPTTKAFMTWKHVTKQEKDANGHDQLVGVDELVTRLGARMNPPIDVSP